MTFPDSLKNEYHQMKIEISWINKKFEIYRQLYYQPETVGLLMISAPSFFQMYQQQMIDDIILSIAKLTDPAKERFGNKHNFSLMSVKEQLPEKEFPQLYPRLDQLYAMLHGLATKLNVWRNRRIAHNAREVALKQEAVPTIRHEQIRKCIEALIAIMRHIDRCFDLGDGPYEAFYLTGDGDTIIKLLRMAHDHKQCLIKKRQNS